MSIAIMSRLFRAHLGSPTRKILAIRLADFADDDGKGIWPTVGRLASETELSERTVQRLLRDFVEEGILIVVEEGGGKPGQATRYDFDMAALARLTAPKKGGDGCHGVTGDTVSPMTLATATGDTDDGYGCHRVTQTVIEPSDKPLSEREARERADARDGEGQQTGADAKAIDRAFKRAFPRWPTYVSDSEAEARKEWFALSDDERAQAADRIADYIAARKGDGRAKHCAFAVYLREKRWERLPPRQEAEAKPEFLDAAPFGKLWGARVYQRLLSGVQRPCPPLTAFEQRMVDDGTADKAALLLEKQARSCWPAVSEMFNRAATGQGVAVSSSLQPLADAFEVVRVGGELWQAWQAEHERRGWPWMPDPGRQQWVYLPAGGPEALSEFEAALRGNGNDGGQR